MGDGFGAPLHLEFAEGVPVVPFNRVQRQKQPLPDLMVGKPLGDQPQYLQLALTQRLDERLGKGSGGEARGACPWLLRGLEGSQQLARNLRHDPASDRLP